MQFLRCTNVLFLYFSGKKIDMYSVTYRHFSKSQLINKLNKLSTLDKMDTNLELKELKGLYFCKFFQDMQTFSFKQIMK